MKQNTDDLISREKALEEIEDWERCYTWDEHCRESKEDYIVSPSDVIVNLPSAQQWIPCSEKPNTDRNVFIARGTHDNMTVCIGHYEHDFEQWYEDRNWFAKCLYDELYWCEIPPLPEPCAERGTG